MVAPNQAWFNEKRRPFLPLFSGRCCYKKTGSRLRVHSSLRFAPQDQRMHVPRCGSSSARMWSLIERKTSWSSISVTSVKGSGTTKLRWVRCSSPLCCLNNESVPSPTHTGGEKLSCYNEITPALTWLRCDTSESTTRVASEPLPLLFKEEGKKGKKSLFIPPI